MARYFIHRPVLAIVLSLVFLIAGTLAMIQLPIAHYPEINEFHLDDYKVRILNGETGTAAVTRVLIETVSDGNRWSTVGASTNIIEASWRALADSIEYGLTMAK